MRTSLAGWRDDSARWGVGTQNFFSWTTFTSQHTRNSAHTIRRNSKLLSGLTTPAIRICLTAHQAGQSQKHRSRLTLVLRWTIQPNFLSQLHWRQAPRLVAVYAWQIVLKLGSCWGRIMMPGGPSSQHWYLLSSHLKDACWRRTHCQLEWNNCPYAISNLSKFTNVLNLVKHSVALSHEEIPVIMRTSLKFRYVLIFLLNF